MRWLLQFKNTGSRIEIAKQELRKDGKSQPIGGFLAARLGQRRHHDITT
jgi:hypothetical protein